jgi:hypothetical protein
MPAVLPWVSKISATYTVGPKLFIFKKTNTWYFLSIFVCDNDMLHNLRSAIFLQKQLLYQQAGFVSEIKKWHLLRGRIVCFSSSRNRSNWAFYMTWYKNLLRKVRTKPAT